jgi:hypothetical protein
MGKNNIIKSLARLIGGLITHEIVDKHTNKPESRPHLSSEIGAYRENIFIFAQEFNWNDEDKRKIRELAIKDFFSRMKNKYPDVKFSDDEVDKLIEIMMKEFF